MLPLLICYAICDYASGATSLRPPYATFRRYAVDAVRQVIFVIFFLRCYAAYMLFRHYFHAIFRLPLRLY